MNGLNVMPGVNAHRAQVLAAQRDARRSRRQALEREAVTIIRAAVALLDSSEVEPEELDRLNTQVENECRTLLRDYDALDQDALAGETL